MRNNFFRLLLIPSLYGALTWTFLVLLIQSEVLQITVGLKAYAIYLYVIIAYVISLFLSYFGNSKRSVRLMYTKREFTSSDWCIFHLSTIIGLFGLWQYIDDFSETLGGYLQFFIVFLNNPILIRTLAESQSSVGFQLSYFSWISICYCLILVCDQQKKWYGFTIYSGVLLIIQLSLNLLFIDRTRPIILIISLGLIYLFLRHDKVKNPYVLVTCIAVFPFLFFIIHALITGKFDKNSGIVFELLAYILGGFGYFSAMLDITTPDYSFFRTFYPLAKSYQLYDSSIYVPSQIPEFFAVPFETNVGTFLEPLYADGGILLVIIGVPILIVSIDFLALSFLRVRTYMGLIVWSHLVVVIVFSFFVSKFNSVHI